MKQPDISRALELQRLLVKFRGVKRALYIPGTDESENDVDHSYFLAMLAWFLAPQIDRQLNTERIIKYALVHDLVEVHAGDTFAFDEEGQKYKKEREHQAYLKLKKEFDDFPEMSRLIGHYEERVDRESRFVYALDKMMPAFLSCLDRGRPWQELKVTYEESKAYDSERVKVSEDISAYFEALHAHLQQHPEYFYSE